MQPDDDKTQAVTVLAKGTVINHYRIVEKIGAGGMGEVYLADDTSLNRQVALKFLPAHFLPDSECVNRFKREAQAAAKLNHPNIVTIYEVGEYKGRPFFAMEHVDGQPLNELIKQGDCPLDKMIDLSLQICQGLQEAHKDGITHRDIKPANILVSKSGRAKLVDFGLASVAGVDKLTKEGSTLGTIGYMSPEQIQGKPTDHRSDLFSFGVVLYEVISCKSPFKGETPAATMNAIAQHTPEPLARFKDGVPDELQRIVSKLLQKDPALRYQTAADVIADLKRLSLTGAISGGTPRRNRRRLKVIATISLVVLAIAGIVGIIRFALPGRTPTADHKEMLAVLPFENLGSADQEYFADGMTDEITTQLAKVNGLGVISRTSVMKYKNVQRNLRKIGKELKVEYVLEGSILWDKSTGANRVRINPQLIRIRDDTHIWAEQYDRELKDIFAVHDEISQAIVNALKLSLLDGGKGRAGREVTGNLEAYNLFLKGRYFLNRRTADGTGKAIESFEQAITLDSGFAPAYGGLADCFNILGYYDFLPPQSAFPKAAAAAEKALKLDGSLAEAHTSLAETEFYFDWDWQAAEREYRRAIELNPGYSTAYQWYAQYLALMGRYDESIEMVKRALELDPLSPVVGTNMAVSYWLARRYDEAIIAYRKVLEIDPDFAITHLFLGLTYATKGQHADAITEFQRGIELSGGDDSPFLAWLGAIYSWGGRKDDGQKALNRAIALSKTKYISPYSIGVNYLSLGQDKQAFAWFDKAYQQRDHWMVSLKAYPLFDNVRSDPRFVALLKKIGLDK